MFCQLVDDPSRTRVADIELSLHQGNGGPTFGGDRARRTREQRVQLALLPSLAVPLGGSPFFEDLLHVARRALRLPEVNAALGPGVAHEEALLGGGLAGGSRVV